MVPTLLGMPLSTVPVKRWVGSRTLVQPCLDGSLKIYRNNWEICTLVHLAQMSLKSRRPRIKFLSPLAAKKVVCKLKGIIEVERNLVPSILVTMQVMGLPAHHLANQPSCVLQTTLTIRCDRCQSSELENAEWQRTDCMFTEFFECCPNCDNGQYCYGLSRLVGFLEIITTWAKSSSHPSPYFVKGSGTHQF
jgi:hypothetical protein